MRIIHRVEVRPFANWLKDRLQFYDNVDALSLSLGEDSTWVGKIMRCKYKTVEVDKIDRILCEEGGTHLRELYPDLYSED